MGDGTNDAEKTTYSIISFPAKKLPDQYKGMIHARWQRSLRHGNEYFKLCDPAAFHKAYSSYIDAILDREGAVVRLAVLSDDNDVCLGWCITEHSTLHYIHVAHEQRRMGVARALTPPIATISHVTALGMIFWNKVLPQAKFNPFV